MPLTQRTIRALSVRLPSARASVRRASTDDLFWCVAGASTSASTLERVGVYLKTACFTHGQLYVAVFTGTQCLAIKKDGTRCRVFSGAAHAQARPLREGHQFCDHHKRWPMLGKPTAGPTAATAAVA